MAIAYDSHSQGNGTGSTVTVSHTMGASDGAILAVGVVNNNASDVVTGVTYGGVAMTKLHTTVGSAGFYLTTWYLNQPTTGVNDVVVSKSSGAEQTYVRALSFTGGNITNAIYNASLGSGGASETVSVTTTVDNSWCAMFAYDSNATPIAASTNSTLRGTVQANVFATFTQTDAPKTPAGAVSMSYTPGGAGTVRTMFVIDGPQNVTVSPTVINLGMSVQAPAITAGANVTTVVIGLSLSVQTPIVSAVYDPYSYTPKHSSTWTYQEKS